MSTLHCALENGEDIHVNKHQKIGQYRSIYVYSRKKEEEECQIAIFLLRPVRT